MTLFKQLWLATIILLLLVFGGSFLVSTLSAKSYLEQQLSIKNSDNATALALSLGQQGADAVLLELTLSAQFDTGFYEFIELRDPDGEIVLQRRDDNPIDEAPLWFVDLFPLEIDNGTAAIQAGWTQVGTLVLRSHSRFAYANLWQSTQILAAIFIAAMLVTGLLGAHLLERILSPLDDVVEQANAIGERRFVTIDEPRTLDFRQVVQAMNTLSARVRDMLEQEAQRLQKWQRDAHIDKITGLPDREPFLKEVAAALESDDVNATGSLSLVRLDDLADLNKQVGRATMDSVLKDIGSALSTIAANHSRWSASRLNGSDFALFGPRVMDAMEPASEMVAAFKRVLEEHKLLEHVRLSASTTIYVHGDTTGALLGRLDGALLDRDEGDGEIAIANHGEADDQSPQQRLEHWRGILEDAFASHSFTLDAFPVVGTSGGLVHYEAPVRLQLDGEKLSAGVFLPWVNRTLLSAQLDREVIDLALEHIARTGSSVAANLSVAAVVEADFVPWIRAKLEATPDVARKLCVELPESMAFRHMDAFRLLCRQVRPLGCQVGIEHVGHQLAELGKLHDTGIDYLKVDASFVRELHHNPANQTLLRTLCTVGHSIGVAVYAEGVREQAEWEVLQELGVDGATGPGMDLPG